MSRYADDLRHSGVTVQWAVRWAGDEKLPRGYLVLHNSEALARETARSHPEAVVVRRAVTYSPWSEMAGDEA